MDLTLYNIQKTLSQTAQSLATQPQVEIPLKETWDKETKTYTREIFVPKGSMIIGFKHRTACVNIVTKGHFLIREGLQGEPKEIKVPNNETYTFITPKDTQKVGYAIEDTIFINVFTDVPTDTYENLIEALIYPIEGINLITKGPKCQ